MDRRTGHTSRWRRFSVPNAGECGWRGGISRPRESPGHSYTDRSERIYFRNRGFLRSCHSGKSHPSLLFQSGGRECGRRNRPQTAGFRSNLRSHRWCDDLARAEIISRTGRRLSPVQAYRRCLAIYRRRAWRLVFCQSAGGRSRVSTACCASERTVQRSRNGSAHDRGLYSVLLRRRPRWFADREIRSSLRKASRLLPRVRRLPRQRKRSGARRHHRSAGPTSTTYHSLRLFLRLN